MPFEFDETYIPELQPFIFTRLSSVYKPDSITESSLKFPEAAKLFTKFKQTVKKDSMPMYSGAVYGPVKYRNDTNVIGMSAVIVDFDNSVGCGEHARPSDNPTMPDDHFGNLEGIPFFFHTTHSNTAGWPKWRLIVPLKSPATLEQWPFVVNGFMHLLGGDDPNIDTSCFELSRAFYVPSYPANHAAAAFSGYSDGKEVVHVR